MKKLGEAAVLGIKHMGTKWHAHWFRRGWSVTCGAVSLLERLVLGVCGQLRAEPHYE
jgi:hypothetical protein